MNTIIPGDNLTTLDQIQDGYVQLVYVDPPYATLGKQNKYNDAFRSDDEWLAMMEPRLTKAYSKLLQSGVIAVSIDDTNQAILKVLMDKLFGKKNFIATLIWVKAASQQTTKTFIKKHEYIICFAKDKKQLKMNRRLSEVKDDKRYKFKDEKETFWIVDGKAVFTRPVIGQDMIANNLFADSITAQLAHGIESKGRPSQHEPIEVVGNEWMVQHGGQSAPSYAKPNDNMLPIEITENQHQQSDLTLSATSQTECRIIGKNDPIEIRLLEIFTNPNDIVLDIFAGSGTTGQAAYENKRQFIILQSNENNIFDEVLKVRLDATIGKDKYIEVK